MLIFLNTNERSNSLYVIRYAFHLFSMSLTHHLFTNSTVHSVQKWVYWFIFSKWSMLTSKVWWYVCTKFSFSLLLGLNRIRIVSYSSTDFLRVFGYPKNDYYLPWKIEGFLAGFDLTYFVLFCLIILTDSVTRQKFYKVLW